MRSKVSKTSLRNMFKPIPVRILALIISLYSCIVIAGWVFGISSLTGILPGQISMQFITAFMFLLSGVALWFIDLVDKRQDEVPLFILPATSMLTLLIITTVFAAGFFGVHTGITDLYIGNPSASNVFPGMPSIPTIVAFILFGIASILVLFESPILRRYVSYLGIFIALIGVIATLGYLFRIPFLYFKLSTKSVPIALNTALMFILLGSGLVPTERIPNEN